MLHRKRRWFFAPLLGAPLVFLIPSCGSEFVGLPSDKDFKNPVDPKVSGNTGQVGGGTGGTGGTGAGGTPTCVDNCTAPTATNSFSLKEANYFNPSTNTCELGGAVALVSSQLNQITVIYRAKYASVGMWKLYGKRFSVAGDGSMALLDTSPVDLYPECYGNPSGVTAFAVTGYKSAQVATRTLYKHWEFDAPNQNLTHVKVNVTCINSPQSGSKTFNLTSSIATSFDTPTLYSTSLGWHGGSGYQSGWNGATTSASTMVCPTGVCLFERSATFGEIYIDNQSGSDRISTYKSGQKATDTSQSVAAIRYSNAMFRNDKLLTFTSSGIYTANLQTGIISSALYDEAGNHTFTPMGWYGNMGILVDEESANRGRLLLTTPFFTP